MEGAPGTVSRLRDIAFFGDDGRGRFTNLVAPLFPAKRIQ
jgi:hypothetical protein